MTQLVRLGVSSGWFLIFSLSSVPNNWAQPAPKAGVAQLVPTWNITLPESDERMTVQVTLTYCFWDPNQDGDVYSTETLLTANAKLTRGERAKFVVSVTKDGASLWIRSGVSLFLLAKVEKKLSIDATYYRDTHPKQNYDGTYVLAEKPNDPKHPLPLTDMGEADSWFQLGITPQP